MKHRSPCAPGLAFQASAHLPTDFRWAGLGHTIHGPFLTHYPACPCTRQPSPESGKSSQHEKHLHPR